MTVGSVMPLRVTQAPIEKRKCYIVGFAPSWTETPWDDREAELWGLNALHRIAGDKRWDRWFQLHDLREQHAGDDQHVAWLSNAGIPVYMWAEHVAKYGIPTAVPYPREWVTNKFGNYFTNSISWMIALAIAEGFEHIGVYGVDMAQDAILHGEYSHQRPSCEYFLGWAKGAGIDLYIPDTSDLLKSAHLYGAEHGGALKKKLEARLKEMKERQAQHNQQVNVHQQASLQLAGAIENTTWLLRTWTPLSSDLPPSNGEQPHAQ